MDSPGLSLPLPSLLGVEYNRLSNPESRPCQGRVIPLDHEPILLGKLWLL